jgi:sugar phosphate isomerase/epimerase
MSAHRPLLISVMQFEEELKNGQLSVVDVMETARHLGIDGVELRRELWPDWQSELPQARRWLEAAGLLVTYATFVTLFSEDNQDQTLLRIDIDTAAALGSPQLRVFLGPAPADEDQAGWDAARAALDYAAGRGVTIALENFARTPGGKLQEIQRVLDRLPHPALATNIDIGNYWLHGEEVPAAIRALGPRAVSVHLKDQPGDGGSPCALGDGVLPLPAILAELAALPQPLIYCFEFRGGGAPEEGIRRSLDYLRNQK